MHALEEQLSDKSLRKTKQKYKPIESEGVNLIVSIQVNENSLKKIKGVWSIFLHMGERTREKKSPEKGLQCEGHSRRQWWRAWNPEEVKNKHHFHSNWKRREMSVNM